MSNSKYSEFANLLGKLRKTKGWTQQEFASRAGATQKTVSRWEQGESRPRAKDLPELAALLDSDLGEMEVAAKYTSAKSGNTPIVGAPTYDIPLPLQSLRPDSFENFCADLLARHYRDRAGVVNRFGGTGSKQFGIDIEVRGDSFGVHTFQCKRVDEFGAQKVYAAVAAHNFKSELKVLLLSNIASPKARMAIAQHAGWQLWDRVDISAKFREISIIDRRDLVDTYFRGQRQPLLGEPEPGPLQTAEFFFKGFIDPNRYFNHAWTLVGRNEELDQLTGKILDDNNLLTMLLGAPGNGKTRLLREVVERVHQQRPDIFILFASQTEDVKAQHLEELGDGTKLLIVDDAHDREDIPQLMRYAAIPENQTKLLLSLRPYGRTMVRHQASLFSMDSPHVAIVELRPRTKKDAQELALHVLQASGEPIVAAEEIAGEIAELTYATPLVTVLAAQIVAKENTPLALIGNRENFQRHVLDRLQKIIAGQIVAGQDVPKLQAVLRMTALLQPVVFDDPGFLKILSEVEGLDYEDAQRLLRLLSEGGVLFKRGLRYRLAPDLLTDTIIQNNFIGINGATTPKVEKVFDLANQEYLKHLLVNLGRLDWRLRNGETADTGSTLLSRLAPKLQWNNSYHNPHIQAVEAVAYYQPHLALNFAARLIEDNHGDAPGVCGMVRNAAFNLDLLEDSCALLWRAGKSDARELNQHPGHGIRILKELATFTPNKPVECIERVVDFAIGLLDRPSALLGTYTPFTILEGALGTDMEETTSNNRNITITRYQLDLGIAKTVRARVVEVIVDSLERGSPRKGFLAATLISEALRGPMRDYGDTSAWDNAHADLLSRLFQALQSPDLHPAVLVRVGISVSWHALYNQNAECASKAQAIIALLDRDLPTRLIRLIGDAWGAETWKNDDSFPRKAHETEIIKMMEDLAAEFPDPEDLYAFINHWLNEIECVAGKTWGTPSIFINRLLQYHVGLAKVIMENQAGDQSPLGAFAGTALATLMMKQERHELISKLLEDGSERSWELVSEAYGRQPEDHFAEADLPVIRRIFQSKEPMVLRHTSSISLNIARRNPALAVELMCIADLTVSPVITRDLFMWLSHGDTIPAAVITQEQWRTLLKNLAQLPKLDDHWVCKFLKKAIGAVPAAVIDMLKSRLQSGPRGYGYKTLHNDRTGDGLALLYRVDGRQLLQEFLLWAVDSHSDDNLKDIGDCVSGLCGKFKPDLCELLLQLLSGGTQKHVNVVASVVRNAHQEFVIEETPFIREILNQAELISDEAVKKISNAAWSATCYGAKAGVFGEPFQEDVRLLEHAKTILGSLSKMDPAYQLYSGLKHYAEESIERQARDKRAMELEDE